MTSRLHTRTMRLTNLWLSRLFMEDYKVGVRFVSQAETSEMAGYEANACVGGSDGSHLFYLSIAEDYEWDLTDWRTVHSLESRIVHELVHLKLYTVEEMDSLLRDMIRPAVSPPLLDAYKNVQIHRRELCTETVAGLVLRAYKERKGR